ncbi:MAG: PTS N-acetylgalactosamine transporter subunit IIB [Fusobacteriaceae bacterium]
MGTPNIVLVRIDNRLIHGQVATAWVNHVGANLLVVPNDEVCENEMRQNLMDMATPQGVQTRYFSIQKTIDVIHKASSKQIIALIIESPQDALKLIEGGVPISHINIGNIHMVPGKKQISKSVCVSDDDIEVFKKISAKGIKIEIQRVPSEMKEDLLGLIL